MAISDVLLWYWDCVGGRRPKDLMAGESATGSVEGGGALASGTTR